MAEAFYILLGALFVGYFALAGYDYGVGMLLRGVARTDTERRLVLGALGPFFLGNEVWLVAGLGLFLAAFPLAEGSLLSGLYPIMVGLVAAIVLFTAAVQLRSRGRGGRSVWDTIIVATATVVAFGWGAVLGAVVQGFPLRFGPLPIITGLAMCALLLAHGAALLTLRTRGTVRDRARAVCGRMIYPAVVLVVMAGIVAGLDGRAVSAPVTGIVAVSALLGAVLAAGRFVSARRPGWALVATGTAAALPVVAVGSSMLPYVFVHEDPARSLTVAQSVAATSSLEFLTIAAVPLLPILLAFQATTWWIWRRAPRDPNFY